MSLMLSSSFAPFALMGFMFRILLFLYDGNVFCLGWIF